MGATSYEYSLSLLVQVLVQILLYITVGCPAPESSNLPTIDAYRAKSAHQSA